MSGMREFVDMLRQEFYQRIDRKTGWGKVELKQEFESSITDALMTYIGDSSSSNTKEETKV